MSDRVAECAVYLLFGLLLCGSALLAWERTAARHHLAFAARQAALTVAVLVATLAGATTLMLLPLIAALTVNVWTYRTS